MKAWRLVSGGEGAMAVLLLSVVRLDAQSEELKLVPPEVKPAEGSFYSLLPIVPEPSACNLVAMAGGVLWWARRGSL